MDIALVGLVGSTQEVQRQRMDVVAAFAQAGQADGHDIEPVIQVLTEPACGHFGGQIPVGRGNQAHVDGHLAGAAQPHQGAFLQGTKKFRLQGQGQLPHFIQKNGSAMCLFKPALARLCSPGEGSAFMPEKLRLEQSFGNGRAVHLDERLLLAPAGQVHRTGKQLFACAGLPQQQHRGL